MVSLLRKLKRNYYSNLNVKDISNNKKFWKKIKNLFPIKQNLILLSPLIRKLLKIRMKLPTFLTITFQKLYICFKFQNPINYINAQCERVSYPTLKSVAKCNPTLQQCKMHINKAPFLSVLLKKVTVIRETKNLNQKKANLWQRYFCQFLRQIHFFYYTFLNKQLTSGLIPQSYLFFQSFWG